MNTPLLDGSRCLVFTAQSSDGEKTYMRVFGFVNTGGHHTFATELAKRLLPERFKWRIQMAASEKNLYSGLPRVTMWPRLSDEEVRKEYRQGDLPCIPMLGNAANAVFLEGMVCGTPVMTNQVG